MPIDERVLRPLCPRCQGELFVAVPYAFAKGVASLVICAACGTVVGALPDSVRPAPDRDPRPTS